jgi:hypothetical protein
VNFLFVFSIEPWFLPPALEFIKVLRKRKYHVDVIYRKSLNKGDYDWLSLDIEPLIIESGNRIIQMLSFNLSIFRLLKKKRAHFVVFTDLWSLQAMAWIFRKKYRSTILWNFELVHNPVKVGLSVDGLKNNWFRYLARKTDYIFVPSQPRVENIASWLKARKKIFIVLNARSLDNVISKEKSKHRTHVLLAGSLSNIHLADKVYKSILHLPEDFVIHIAGLARGNYENELNDFIANHNLGDRLIYYGLLNKTDLDKLLGKAHIGVIIYNKDKGITGSNIAPTKLGDYISAGLNVVGSDQEYLKYWLEERKLGRTISEITEEQISSAIHELSSKNKKSDQNKVRSVFLEEYNMDVQVNKVLKELDRKE